MIVAQKYKFSNNKKFVSFLFILPSLLFLLIFIAFPVIYNLFISFYTVNIFEDTRIFEGLQNYVEVFKSSDFLSALKNTVIWTAGSVIGQIVLGLGAALLINKEYKYMTVIRSFLLLPYVMPVIAVALVSRWLLHGHYGLISYILQAFQIISYNQSPLGLPALAMVSVILVNIWRAFPFTMVLYWAALKGINEEEYEAAAVDGAGPIQIFFYITLPHLKRVTLVLLIIRTIWNATYFDLIWLITGGGPAGYTEHLPIEIYKEAMGLYRFGYSAAIAVVLAAFLLILVIVYLKIGEEKV